MIKLHSTMGKKTTSGGQIYCGPTAVMAITGRAYVEVQEAINSARFRRPRAPIFGAPPSALKTALRGFGYHMVPLVELNGKEYKGLTIARVLRERGKAYINKCLLIQTRDHYVVVKGRKFIDNHTKDPVWIRSAPHRRARVKMIYEIREYKS